MYKFCKEFIQKTPDRVIQKWEVDLGRPLEEWKLLLACKYQLTKKTKLQTFIFKFFHRIIPTEEFLFRIGKSNTDICRLCEENIETLVHYMCTCPIVVQFWQELGSWIENRMGTRIPMDMYVLMFGDKEKSAEDYVLLIAKYYLYLCKHKSRFPLMEEFLVVLRDHCKIESRMSKVPIHIETLNTFLV